jgi:RHS repeat-associated protein
MLTVTANLTADLTPGADGVSPKTALTAKGPLSWNRLGVDVPISLECTGEDGFVYGGSRRQFLYYLRARYYDTATGQFLSRDPMVATTRDPYAYVVGNPLNRTDPTGMWGLPDLNPADWVGAVADTATHLCLRNPFGGDNDSGGCHTTLSTSQGGIALGAVGIIASGGALLAPIGAGTAAVALGWAGVAAGGAAVAEDVGPCVHGNQLSRVAVGLGAGATGFGGLGMFATAGSATADIAGLLALNWGFGAVVADIANACRSK